ncbi:hypothetical protein AGMMS49525_02400 [Bacteroidia bacterium]|nr:hypothetical protein AGMMS49525_02400 [Bacteroidia bacterium]
MKKKELFFSLLGLVALSSSCATDLYQSNPLQSSGREISFKTFADKQLSGMIADNHCLFNHNALSQNFRRY